MVVSWQCCSIICCCMSRYCHETTDSRVSMLMRGLAQRVSMLIRGLAQGNGLNNNPTWDEPFYACWGLCYVWHERIQIMADVNFIFLSESLQVGGRQVDLSSPRLLCSTSSLRTGCEQAIMPCLKDQLEGGRIASTSARRHRAFRVSLACSRPVQGLAVLHKS